MCHRPGANVSILIWTSVVQHFMCFFLLPQGRISPTRGVIQMLRRLCLKNTAVTKLSVFSGPMRLVVRIILLRLSRKPCSSSCDTSSVFCINVWTRAYRLLSSQFAPSVNPFRPLLHMFGSRRYTRIILQ